LDSEEGLRVVFLGPPACGKGTQVQLLEERTGIEYLDTGGMLRRAASEGTPAGLLAKSYMDRGALVPDEVLNPLLREAISRPEYERGFLLDGYPRTASQALFLDGVLDEMGTVLTAAVAIEVPEETLVRRQAGRLICRACGRVYNMHTLPPPAPGRCECGGELFQRSDDSEEAMRERLRVYRSQTAPLVEFYGSRGKLRAVDGTGAPEDVHLRILRVLDLV